jgi:hypothetical protein
LELVNGVNREGVEVVRYKLQNFRLVITEVYGDNRIALVCCGDNGFMVLELGSA